MPANLENSAVATGLEKVSFHSNPKEGKCQKNGQTIIQLHSFYMLVRNAQNPSSKASTAHETITSRCISWI